MFALKAPEDPTHVKRLAGIQEGADFFVDRVAELGPCLGPILFQLPPSLPKSVGRLRELGELVRLGTARHPALRVAIEFRHASWYADDVYGVMREFNMAVCHNESPDGRRLTTAAPTADWTYTRFHKAGDRGPADYSGPGLEAARGRLEARGSVKAQFCFFLNDHGGNSVRNAEELHSASGTGATRRPGEWRPAPVVIKGGRGSIEGAFAMQRSASGDRDGPSPPKRARVVVGGRAPTKGGGTRGIDAFLRARPG